MSFFEAVHLVLFLYEQYVAMGNDTDRTITRAKNIVNGASAVRLSRFYHGSSRPANACFS